MQTIDHEVEALEDALGQPNIALKSALTDETKEVISAKDVRPDTVITLYATVAKAGASTGVVKVATLTPEDLYGCSSSALSVFNDALDGIGSLLKDALSKDPDEVEFELAATDMWTHVGRMGRFLGISKQHDELISCLLEIAAGERTNSLTASKASALQKVVDTVANTYILPDEILDAIYDVLEAGGFDLNAAMALYPSEIE